MPACLRTVLRPPSQPTRYRPRSDVPSASRAVTPSASCSTPTTSHPRRMRAPSSVARSDSKRSVTRLRDAEDVAMCGVEVDRRPACRSRRRTRAAGTAVRGRGTGRGCRVRPSARCCARAARASGRRPAAPAPARGRPRPRRASRSSAGQHHAGRTAADDDHVVHESPVVESGFSLSTGDCARMTRGLPQDPPPDIPWKWRGADGSPPSSSLGVRDAAMRGRSSHFNV